MATRISPSEDGRASLTYYDRVFKQNAIKLLSGEYYVSENGLLLMTVLGSCISACIRDSVRQVGGMNHFMLPSSTSQRDDLSQLGVSMRFGVHAMEILINELLRRGSRRENLEAKIFGGASMMSGSAMRIGQKNAEFVQEYLAFENIRIVAKDILGDHARKVYFFPHTGKVLVHTLRSQLTHDIMESEQRYSLALNREPMVEGASELF